MVFGSFIPNRKGNRKQPPPTPPPTDPEATAVNPAWAGMLQQHLAAQQSTPVGPRPPQGSDGLRHGHPTPPLPQPQPQDAQNCVYCRDSGPNGCALHPKEVQPQWPKFANTDEYNAYMRQHRAPQPPPKPYMSTPKPTKPIDPIFAANRENQPIELSRVCRYRSEGGGILVVVGYQVISANQAGVIIVPNGRGPMPRVVIPWHRVWELSYDPGDPIENFSGR